MSKIELVSVGSDPEMFLYKNGSPISSIGLFPGTKEKPHQITEEGETVQVDNVAIEFGIKPSKNSDEFIESLTRCYEWTSEHLSNIDPLIQVMPVSSVEFPESELKSRGARRFGCEPDFNAWESGMTNRPPDSTGSLRSCGGHIHLGVDVKEGDFDPLRLVRLMDKNVGTYAADICGDERRRELYGKAGAFRLKPYGLEYRTPSVSWLKEEAFIVEVFNRINQAIEEYNNGEDATIVTQMEINEGLKLQEA